MIKDKKRLLILVVFLVVLYGLISIIISIFSEYKNIIFIGSSTKVSVKNGNINIYRDNAKLIKQKVKIYFKDEFIDAYISSQKSENAGIENLYVAYNENGARLIPEKELIAHTDDISIKFKNITTKESDSLSEIYNFAKSNNISIKESTNLDYLEISNFDYDDDGKDEYIYSFGLIEDSDYESYIIMKKDNNYILIDSEKSSYDVDYKRFYFLGLIDFNNDGDYEFVIRKLMSEYGPDYYELYNFDGNEFTKIGAE